MAGRGLVCLNELYHNSEHVPNLTRSLSPPSIPGKLNSYIHLLFPDKEKGSPASYK